MRELRQDWRDLFGGFKLAFDIWKIFLALLGLVITVLVFWGITSITYPWVVAIILGALVVIVLGVKFATSESGFTVTKAVMWLVTLLVVAGVTVLFCLWGPDETGQGGLTRYIQPAALIFFGYLIWALFGGAISRIAVVEVSTDDRIGLGEALCYANKKYTAYLGSTLLPLIAVLMLMACTFVYGLLFNLPVVNVILSCFFFLVLLDGFLMFLILLGGLAGAPLMYPAVSAEGNDAFDAISRSYSYVFGRPWRYLWYNLMAFAYGAACVLFVGLFVWGMLALALGSVDVATNGEFSAQIKPRVVNHLQPLMEQVNWLADYGRQRLVSIDTTGHVVNYYSRVVGLLDVERLAHGSVEPVATEETRLGTEVSAVIITVFIYLLVGLVLAYVVSLFFSLQATIYLLLRKVVDGADVTEVYLEEEPEEEESAGPVAEPSKPEASQEQK